MQHTEKLSRGLTGLFAILYIFLSSVNVFAQKIPSDRVLDIDELQDFVTEEAKMLIEAESDDNVATLAAHFRRKFSQRFFYDHETVYQRLAIYYKDYKEHESHRIGALDHMAKYSDSTQWLLPFDYLNGAAVNAYALRHLARQHKMVDIAMMYFQSNKDSKYIRYFENQMRSLNYALAEGSYEKIEDGNGVYEVFRSGYRILNWLLIHNLFLNEPEYSDADQLTTIATLVQHAAHLYERNDTFRSGNHQTKGMSSLAMLGILLDDFVDADLWRERAMIRLEEHLSKEINPDGFQFERSVHYHMSDIKNYFYPYQLAKINDVPVSQEWENKLKSLFDALVKIGYPDRSAPVLQDDTEIPWAEKNDISGAMTLGYLLFDDPEYGYFANDQVSAFMYWFLKKEQLDLLAQREVKRPNYGSLHFPDTKYYIMREGWKRDNNMMIISAGLDHEKPDHQHGDMLGIQAMANGKVILPNYQVRYSLKDFDLFKNSMVKNVALVDDELQGKEWTSNKGGSGFGKFRNLPNPKTVFWATSDEQDVFIGTHDGFEDIGVKYSRQVIFVDKEFWIVKDNFQANEEHVYKQVWQGHYSTEQGPNLIRATFDDASGFDILQLYDINGVVTDGARGKQWSVLDAGKTDNFSFLTILYPYRGYTKRIDEDADSLKVGDWQVNTSSWSTKGKGPRTIQCGDRTFIFGANEITKGELIVSANRDIDLLITQNDRSVKLMSLSDGPATFAISGFLGAERMNRIILRPGQEVTLDLKSR